MNKLYPKSVKIIEVGPRDGLQNDSTILSTLDKYHYIKLLIEAGLSEIEVTSFVKPSKIPQMKDASELLSKVIKNFKNRASFPCLVPNKLGLNSAIKSGATEIAIFTATSETFNKHNINATIKESFKRFEEITRLASSQNIKVRGYISTVFGCPYEKETNIDVLNKNVEKLLKLGCYEVSLGDTIGIAVSDQVQKVLDNLKKNFSLNLFSMHFHDSNGQALNNVKQSLENGIDKFDSSSGGLGGCPYAPGAPGNLATEDLVYLLNKLNISHGINLSKLKEASKYILKKVNKKSTAQHANN